MASGRFRQACLGIFRALQFILSIVALGCGIFIIYTMYSMAESAEVLEGVLEDHIEDIGADSAGADILQHSLVPVLRYLQGTPSRSIVITVVAFWSTIFIIYMVYANRQSQHTNRDLKRNSRFWRILLSTFTLAMWLAAIVCSILLVIQYGIFTVTLGPQTKAAMMAVREGLEFALEQAIQSATKDNKTLSNAFNIVSKIMTVGAMAIVVLVSSLICGTVAFVDCFVACCMSGKGRGSAPAVIPYQDPNLEKGGFQTSVAPMSVHINNSYSR